jgi:uncharacterized protein YndB with AHSA1/START domain
VEPERRVVFTWGDPGQESRVEIALQDDEGGTAAQVTEGEWEGDPTGIERLGNQTYGWTHFLCCLKAYLEYGIALRTGSVTRRHRERIEQARRTAA